MLATKLTCPSCQATLKPANPIPAGKTVKCPRCAKTFQVPEETETPPDQDAPPAGSLPDNAKAPTPADSQAGNAKAPTPAGEETSKLVTRFTCPACQAVLKPGNPIPIGKNVKCPKCAAAIVVKADEEPASAPPAEKANGEAAPKLVERFTCPHCQAVLKPAAPLPVGKAIKCPKCSQVFPIQAEAESKPPEEPSKASADFEVVDDAPEEVTQTTCTGCHTALKLLKPVAVGKKIKCPRCALVFVVAKPPKVEEEPVAADVDQPANDPFAFNFDEPPATRKPKQPEAKKTAEMPAVKAAEPGPEPAAAPTETEEVATARPGLSRNAILTIAGSVLGVALLAGGAFFVLKVLPGILPSAQWQEFSPPNGRFQLLLPGKPMAQEINLAGLPAAAGQRFGAESGNANFSVAFADLDPSAQGMLLDDLYRIEKQRLITPGSKLDEESSVTTSGVEGKECRVLDEKGARIARIFLVRSKPQARLYILLVEGPVQPGDERITKCFDSFKIVADPTAAPSDSWTTAASDWSPDPAVAPQLNPEIKIGDYKIRPPRAYAITEHKAKDNLQWKFLAKDKPIPALTIILEDAQSPLSLGTPGDALTLFIQGIERYLGKLEPQTQPPSEEGSVNGIRFQRLRFSTPGLGLGIIYLGRDAGQTLIAVIFEQGDQAAETVKVMNASMLSFRKEGRQPDPPPTLVKTPPKVEPKVPARERTVLRHNQPIQAVALTGKVVATAGPNIQAHLWELGQQGQTKQRATLAGHKEAIRALAFAPAGDLLASASTDKTIKLWDPATGKENRTLEGHKGPVTCVAFSPDGKFLVSGGQDKAVKVWDPVIGIELFTLEGHAGPLTALAISRDSNHIASADQTGQIIVWDIATRKPREPAIVANQGAIHALAYLGADTLATAGADGNIKTWDATTHQLKNTLAGHKQAVTCLASDRDGLRLASGSADQTVRLWDPQTGKLLGEWPAHQEAINALALSPDGNLLITGSADRTAKVWDVQVAP